MPQPLPVRGSVQVRHPITPVSRRSGSVQHVHDFSVRRYFDRLGPDGIVFANDSRREMIIAIAQPVRRAHRGRVHAEVGVHYQRCCAGLLVNPPDLPARMWIFILLFAVLVFLLLHPPVAVVQ